MPYSKKTRLSDIKIQKFSRRGNGVGHYIGADGSFSDAEISYGIPGELIRSSLEKKRGKWTGHIEEIIEASPHRISPKCIHFGSCGGCRWQQISYEAQLKFKESIVKELFEPLLPPGIQMRPIIGDITAWNYRNKMEFTFSSDLNRQKYLGLIMDSSKGKVLNLSECHLVNSWFVEGVKAVKQWWDQSPLDAFNMRRNTGFLRTLTLREGMKSGDRMVILMVSRASYLQEDLNDFVMAVRNAIEPVSSDSKLSIFLRIQQSAKGETTTMYDMLLYGTSHIREELDIQAVPNKETTTFKFVVSPSSFFQPNIRQAEKFFSLALQLAEINENSIIYDLFCGTGTLGICASRTAKKVIGIEISSEATSDAIKNVELNNCQNVMIFSGAVRHVLKKIMLENEIPPPDILFIDPPRPGLDPEALQQVIQLNAHTILFISCNPETQASNIAELMKHGYAIKVIQPFDQFPQTMHIENLIILIKTQ